MPCLSPLFAQVLPKLAPVEEQVAAKTAALEAQSATVYQAATEFLTTKGIDFGINVLAAVAIFLLGRWGAMLLISMLNKLLVRARVDDTLIKFASNLVYLLLLLFVIIAALNQLGINTTSLSAIIAAAGLAVGLALQGSLGNFAAGVMLIFFKPFRVGDSIEAAGVSGMVEEILLFNTKISTGDNVQIIVPNGAITSGTIKNLSAKPTRRIDLVVGCGYGDDLRAVKEYLEQLLKTDARILAHPAPVVAVNELGDSSVNFVVRPWVKTDDYWPTRWDLTEKIRLDFAERGFSIPYPSRDLYVHNQA